MCRSKKNKKKKRSLDDHWYENERLQEKWRDTVDRSHRENIPVDGTDKQTENLGRE